MNWRNYRRQTLVTLLLLALWGAFALASPVTFGNARI